MKTFRVLGYSDPPFLLPSIGWITQGSVFAACLLHKFSDSFRQKSVTQTINWSLFKESKFPQSFHDEKITSADIFLRGKVFWFKLCVGGCHWEIILRCLSSFVVSRQKLKGLFIWIYIIGDLNGKMLPLRRKEFSEFLDPAITGQILFFCARNPDMIVGCLSSSAVFRIGKTLFE